jgi:glycogen operon protein
MIEGGDELYRTQFGNNNPYNLDTPDEYLDLAHPAVPHFFNFCRKLFAFRNAHAELRPADFFNGQIHAATGLKDITWLREDGQEADGNYLDNPTNHFLAYRLDRLGPSSGLTSIYVGFNGWSSDIAAKLPPNLSGKHWHRVADTATWMEDDDNFKDPGSEELLTGNEYTIHARTLILLIER